MPKKKQEQGRLLYVKAASLEDICRHACNFDFTAEPLIMYRHRSGNRLIALGEHIGDTQLAYYVESRGDGSILLYEPGNGETGESARFVGSADQTGKHYINVVHADLSAYRESAEPDKKGIVLINVEKPEDLVGAIARKSVRDESMACVYATGAGAKRIVAFNALGALADDKLTVYYSRLGSKPEGNFARYDYKDNSLCFVRSMESHAYVYAKVINLAEPFPFLKG
jgi:hypothetical protein